ncbi:MAG TPA: hypothetical protein VEU06_10990 [Micropepsaceae bacterium]|nr:hypothetical protein [Micropepsaceae bacterium]
MSVATSSLCGAAVVFTAALFLPALAAEKERIPNFAPDSITGWLKPPGDEFIQPESGPGPVKADPAHPYFTNALFPQETPKIADLSNQILQPWVIAQMKRENDAVMAGKVGFTARSRCWPHGVPGFLLYPVHPIFIIQTEKEVIMTWGQDFQLRRIYLNVPHSEHPKPSWYGESIGHYEGGDTLVVDTIGLNDKTYVDNYRTPHTTALHVVERFRMIDNGNALEVRARVEDRGAFTMPWTAVQRYKRDQRSGEVPLHEMVCAENNTDHFNQGLAPIPQADKPDF